MMAVRCILKFKSILFQKTRPVRNKEALFFEGIIFCEHFFQRIEIKIFFKVLNKCFMIGAIAGTSPAYNKKLWQVPGFFPGEVWTRI
jgi:hypothetical protein